LILLRNFGGYLTIDRAYSRTLEYILHTKSRYFRVWYWGLNTHTHKTTLSSREKNTLRILKITIIFTSKFVLYTTYSWKPLLDQLTNTVRKIDPAKDGHKTRTREMRIVGIIFMRKYLEKSPF
jgi:hypothetical protein